MLEVADYNNSLECMVTSIIRIEVLNSIVKLCALRGITEKNFVNPIQ